MINYQNRIVQEDMSTIVSQSYIQWDRMTNKSVMITGANGMLATYMVYVLAYLNETQNANIKIIATARNIEKAKARFSDLSKMSNFELIKHDVTENVNYESNVDYIVHAASNASPRFILEDPVGIINANVIGTLNMLKLAEAKKTTNFLFLSTREIYGKSVQDKIDEEAYGGFDILATRACYPESKRMAETLLKSYSEQYGVPFTVARIAHSYGPGMVFDNDGRIMSDLLSNVLHNEDIILKSDGSAERAFCYLSDAVSALFLTLLQGVNQNAYNVGNEDSPVQIRDLASKLVELFPEKAIKVVFDIPKNMSAGYSKMGRTYLDTTKIENLGWEKVVGLEEGLKRTIQSVEV